MLDLFLEVNVISQKMLSTIIPILRRHQVIRAKVFGSYAAGLERPESDLDLIVEMPSEKTYFDLGNLHADLQDALGKPVDLLFDGTPLHPSFQASINKNHIPIL